MASDVFANKAIFVASRFNTIVRGAPIRRIVGEVFLINHILGVKISGLEQSGIESQRLQRVAGYHSFRYTF